MRRFRFIFKCLRISFIEKEIYLFFHPTYFVFESGSANSFYIRSSHFDNRPLHRSLKKILKTRIKPRSITANLLKQRIKDLSRYNILTVDDWTLNLIHESFPFGRTLQYIHQNSWLGALYMCNAPSNTRFSHAGEHLLTGRLNQTHWNR